MSRLPVHVFACSPGGLVSQYPVKLKTLRIDDIVSSPG
jgi:hypothetical protein